MNFQSVVVGINFNIIGCSRFLGLLTERKRMGGGGGGGGGGVCLPCVLFSSSGYNGSNPDVLVSQPLTAFHKALELFHKHARERLS